VFHAYRCHPGPGNFRYPTYLSPDTGTHKLAVLFSRIATMAPFGPSTGLPAVRQQQPDQRRGPVRHLQSGGFGDGQVVVSFDTSATAPATANSSSGYILNVAATDPACLRSIPADPAHSGRHYVRSEHGVFARHRRQPARSQST